MGEENNNIRNQDTIELLNYGFANYKMETIVDRDDDLGVIPVKFGKKESVKLKLIEDAVDLVNIVEENSYSYELVYDDVTAPVYVGNVVGQVNIYANRFQNIRIKIYIGPKSY